ncbi:cilia- and flagella-associated protein 299 [Salarias fasciatus]|uniref:cilia- and flagella-associated protein 299 n=1 Tax=Salarias fasciatus TaxID=181472 RepID=UPI0011764CF5|nr:cilia- and flagella-associated protein 299 [Salarias fasciatus]
MLKYPFKSHPSAAHLQPSGVLLSRQCYWAVASQDLFHLKVKDLSSELMDPDQSREDQEDQGSRAAARRVQAAKTQLSFSRAQPVTLASAGKDLKDDFLRALAELERANRSGKTTSVIFIRDYNPLGQEVSGYIDYAHRLKTEDFAAYFSGKKRLMPGRSDLCYYNWKTQTSTSNSSPNFEVVYEDVHGLLFKSKRDKKLLNVDPQVAPDEDTSVLQSPLYQQVVVFNHHVRTV